MPDTQIDTSDDDGPPPESESPPNTPAWVKAFGIGAVVLVLLVTVMLLAGHGPGRHHGGNHMQAVGGLSQ